MLKMINWKNEVSHIGNAQGSRIPFDRACLEAQPSKYIAFLNLHKRTLGKVNSYLISSLYPKLNIVLGSQREKLILPV